ncbi:hypothetical protein Poli38472_006406 [Pythium oligandrum]|uniref:Alpha-type protein kinase domain-containing protein n=1 Tax=Pythium oligandrum TaxID=41045 RepID=A0A8K1C4Q0_PYTOL|nr:hypothetical protein Poli38472_006406 [Pythium oligandrum]|eukprot:TMW56396.1 hypothetical protein Poli38472_006406 [Pythium oligandrum]
MVSTRRYAGPMACTVVATSGRDACGGQDTAESRKIAVPPRLCHTITASTEKRLARIQPITSGRQRPPLAPRQSQSQSQMIMRSQERTRMYEEPQDDGQYAGQASSVKSEEVRSMAWSMSSAASSVARSTLERTREVTGNNNLQDDVLARMTTLKALCDQGFISPDEYERRKNAIIDELTFTSRGSTRSRRGTATRTHRRSFFQYNGVPMIVPHTPNFRSITPEVAIKHVFDYDTRQWSSLQVHVALDETPFSKGSLRVVYHLQDVSEGRRRGSYVAKVAIDPDEDPQTYFRDIELQAHCASYANLYNSYNPPKRVEFLKAWVLELTERDGILCAVEEYIPGDYRKHNNNFGSVSDDERNTPQAFSHFTYEASNHEVLAVDIQGVGDKYTDPQLHTLNGNDFGKGNLGVLGFQKFLSSHRCNSICRYLKLPPVNPKDRHTDHGTLPLQELMNTDRIRPTRFDSKHYYEQAPMLQKYIAQCRALEEKERREAEASSRRFSCSDVSFCGCAVQ